VWARTGSSLVRTTGAVWAHPRPSPGKWRPSVGPNV